MKKVLFAAALALGLFASCAKNDVTPVVNDNQKIAYQAVVGKTATKATSLTNTAGTAYPAEVSFGSAAFMHTESWGTETAKTAGTYIEKSEVKHNATGKYWSTDKTYYWPIDNVKLTFFSFSPWETLNGAANITAADGVTIGTADAPWDVDNNQTVDVMVADVAKDKKSNDGSATGTVNGTAETWTGVPTVFRHKLSQIVEFQIKTADDYIAAEDNGIQNPAVGDMHVYINSIKIKNVYTQGTFKSGIDVAGADGGAWTKTGTDKGYELVSGTGTANEVFYDANTYPTKLTVKNGNNAYLLVLPQAFSQNTGTNGAVADTDPQIEITYTVRQYYNAGTEDTPAGYKENPVTKYVSLYDIHATDHKWAMNKKITYQLTINLRGDKEIRWAPKTEDWVGETLGSSVTIQ